MIVVQRFPEGVGQTPDWSCSRILARPGKKSKPVSIRILWIDPFHHRSCQGDGFSRAVAGGKQSGFSR
jgi:hypothetical protein